MTEHRVEVVIAEGLVVGPNDKLIIKVGLNSLPDDSDSFEQDMLVHLKHLGLADRTLILTGDDFELAKVEGTP